MIIVYGAIGIFGMVAIVGMYLLSLILRDKQIPKGATIVHGLFAVLGLVLLIIYCFGHAPGLVGCIIIFATAAMLGLVLNYRGITGKKVPKWFAITHGLVAILGFTFLLLFAFTDM